MAYSFMWTKDKIDLSELASKRWVEQWSINKIMAHFGFGSTFIVRKLWQLRQNIDPIYDGHARSHTKSRKYRFMGGA